MAATEVRANCPSTAAARVCEFGLTLQIVNETTGETKSVIQGIIIDGS